MIEDEKTSRCRNLMEREAAAQGRWRAEFGSEKGAYHLISIS